MGFIVKEAGELPDLSGNDGEVFSHGFIDHSGKLHVAGTFSVDPAGLATSAKQDTQISVLNDLLTNTPALGRVSEAGCVPVVVAAPDPDDANFTQDTTGLVASHILTTNPGSVEWLGIINNNGSAITVMAFDSDTLPANGASPLAVWDVPATSIYYIPPNMQIRFAEGFVIADSTTKVTLTAGANTFAVVSGLRGG